MLGTKRRQFLKNGRACPAIWDERYERAEHSIQRAGKFRDSKEGGMMHMRRETGTIIPKGC